MLIAIDGNSLMHRAYYALPGMTTKKGTPTGALYGFLSMLLKLVEKNPSHMLVAFDMHGPTFRHEKYADYKAGRRETPDDLRVQFPILKELLAALGIAVCECQGYEADDILGTFARRAEQKDMDALIVTGDRDALQLITDRVHVLLTKKGISETVEYDPELLMEDYHLDALHMRDLKGLMGDSSDNIPGIPGVGEKTALKLLDVYHTLENTLANAANIKGKLGEKVAQYADQARQSYWLGTIVTDVPVEMDISDCIFVPEQMSEALPKLYDLELRNIAARLPKPAPKERPAVAGCETIRITSKDELAKVIQTMTTAQQIALYSGETLMLACDAQKQYEIVLTGTLLEPGMDASEVWRALAPLLSKEHPEKLVYDAKELMHTLEKEGIILCGVSFDAMIADYLLNAIHPVKSFHELCMTYLNLSQPSASALFLLQPMMLQQIEEKGLKRLLDVVEMPLVEVLYDMERSGFPVSRPILEELQAQFAGRLSELEKEIYEQAGETFNILSTKQLGVILFEKLGLPIQKKTRTGYSTDSEVLEKLQDEHPIIPLLIEYRFLAKIKSTFVDGLLNLQDEEGRIHTTFHQNVTATGRISSTEPNLQNIPVRTQVGREIRKAFVPSPGRVLVGADYSQIELRVLAHMSEDRNMQQIFHNGGDIHTATAAEVFGVLPEEVTRTQRSAAKAVNFGIVYGISDFGLSRNLGITRKQAKQYIEMYLDRYPGVNAFMRRCVEEGRQRGWAQTLLGRRRELPELKSSNYNVRSFGERVAMNMPIQGTAADIIKLAMVRVHAALKSGGYQAQLILQVHDELILDVPPDECEAVIALVRDCMENVMQLDVPLEADVHAGQSWFETK